MPRYDERAGATRLYVGHISSRTRTRDLEDLFSRYGRVRDVDLKYDFAFVNFSDPRDADEARYYLNGRTVDGCRIVVEFAKQGPGGGGGFSGSSRDYVGRGPLPGTGRCYNCGHDGHWARDCKAGDWKNRCYRCGQRGHIERNCTGSPRRHKRSPSRSRSPPSARRARSRSRSQSRSQSPRKEESSPARHEQQCSPTSASRSRSSTPCQREVTSRSVSPVNGQSPVDDRHPQENSRSRSVSPAVNGQSPVDDGLPQGNSRSPSTSPPRDIDKSPIRDDQSPSHSGGE